MAHHKTFAGELIHGEFKDAWNDFKGFLGNNETVADALKQGWSELPAELQNGLVHGSAIINEISTDLDKVPDEIYKLVQSKFPDVSEDSIKAVLQGIQTEFTKVEALATDTPQTTIANIQAYLKTKKDSALDRVLSQLAQFAANILSPTSAFSKIVTYIEMAFRVLVKPPQE